MAAVATDGDDTLDGTAGADTISGLGGSDSILLGDGDDLGYGRTGRDTLNGGAGDDTLYGGGGNDELRDEGGTDTFDGGAGNDTILLDSRGLTEIIYTLTVDLAAGTQGASELEGDDDLLISIENYTYAGAFNTTISGNAGANRLLSGAGTDALYGRDGADLLKSGASADRLFGGNGNDRLQGGRGNDSQTGGAGADRFVFQTGDGRDRINDFDAIGTVHDVLDIRGVSAVVNFLDLRTNHMAQVGENVVIRAGNDSIVLVNVKIGQLDAGDFLF